MVARIRCMRSAIGRASTPIESRHVIVHNTRLLTLQTVGAYSARRSYRSSAANRDSRPRGPTVAGGRRHDCS